MSFAKAIGSGFRNWKSFGGRASRKEYWYFQLFLFLAALAGTIVLFFLAALGGEMGAGFGILVLLAFSIFVFVPALSLTIRRLRDGGFHWALIFLTFVPLGGVALFIMVLLPTSQKAAGEGSRPETAEQQVTQEFVDEETPTGAAVVIDSQVKTASEVPPRVSPIDGNVQEVAKEHQETNGVSDTGVKEKLARLEQLHSEGRISANQLSTARAKLLGQNQK